MNSGDQHGRRTTQDDDCPENHANWRDYKANYCPTCGVKL